MSLKFRPARRYGRGGLPDEMVHAMHEAYRSGLSLRKVGALYGRKESGIKWLFETRGLPTRKQKGCNRVKSRHLPNGCFEPCYRHTRDEILKIIKQADRLAIPEALKTEWRHWALEKRGWFIERLRAKLKLDTERPSTPFSKNVEPFDYSTPLAHEICAELNRGRDSRTAKIKLNICSQGVIYQGVLWFWCPKTGYQLGEWKPGKGRPLLHHHIFEQTHGIELPRDTVIRFRDRNPNNHDPKNLCLSTRNDVLRETQAEYLSRKSRERTELLLQRNQRKEKPKHDLLDQLA